MTSSGNWPLKGVRIIELSSEIAGPYCTKLFVDGGATVIKVEAPEGDPLRRWRASGEAVPEGRDGALFQFLNASKQSICLDLHDQSDRQWLLELVKNADIIVEDFGCQGLQQYDLNYETFSAINPAVSLISISPWGLTGPYANRPATEFTLQAASGSTASRGLPGRKPVTAGGRLGEWICGTFASVAAVTAWLSAKETGKGQHADVSALESILLSMTTFRDMVSQWTDDLLPRSIEMPSIEEAKDGWVGFCTITGQQWLDFCAMIGRQDIADNEEYLTHMSRMKDMKLIKGAINEWTKQHTVDEIIELSTLLRIPAAPIGSGDTLLDMDHMQQRGMFVDNPGGFKQPRPGCIMEKTMYRPVGAAPTLNEHRDEIFAELKSLDRPPVRVSGKDELPLKGLRVIDLTAFWAGPYATSLIAQFGADVVKVESIQRPDGMRFAGGLPNHNMWEWSSVFAGANCGKRAITLSLDKPEGMKILHKLIADADVVIENFSARVMGQFGLTKELIHSLNPRAILVRMPAFGLDGPWRDRPGFAMNVEQVSGQAWVTGYKDVPLVPRGSCDPVGGIHAFFALMLALEDRKKTGEGQLVEVPLMDAALNVGAEQVIDYTAYNDLLGRQENRTKKLAPQGIFACEGEDNWLAVSIESDEQWQNLCDLVGPDGDLNDTKYSDLKGRQQNHDYIDEVLDRWFSSQDVNEVEDLLLSAGIPAQFLVNGHRLMPNPQLIDRNFFYTTEHPITGVTRYPDEPVKYSKFDALFADAVPPCLGQHNQEILGDELGLSDQELAELTENQIIGDRPSFM